MYTVVAQQIMEKLEVKLYSSFTYFTYVVCYINT